MMELKKFLHIAAWVALFSSSVSQAHNQNPAIIRKTMDRVYQSVGAKLPPNVLKGDRLGRSSAGAMQVFDARKGEAVQAVVGQIEVQEVLYVVAVDPASGAVRAVGKEGRLVDSSEWKDLAFLEAVRTSLVPTKAP